MTRLEQQMQFILEIDKLKEVYRQSYLHSQSRKENDAEHSFHIALMAAILSEYSNEKVDVAKVMTMVLIHDIVEIDAGDTYAYDTKGYESKSDRETKAAKRIFSMLPEDQSEYFYHLWEEFEKNETKEAHFANTVDRMEPIMLNHETQGKAWREHGISFSQVMKRNENTKKGSELLAQYIEENYIRPNVGGALKDDR